MILLSCRYLQPIRIWRLLHEEYSITHFLFRKKKYWWMSNNQTSLISQKTEPAWRENLIDLVNKISGFILRDRFPPLYQLTEASMPGDVYLCVMVNIQNISLTSFLKKGRSVKWWGTCKAQWQCQQNVRVRETNNKLSSPRAMRAESARAVTGRRCPHSGEGKDFFMGQQIFFTKTAISPERKDQKSIPRWEINRHAEGYKWVIDQNWRCMAKIGFFGQKPRFWAQKKALTFGD